MIFYFEIVATARYQARAQDAASSATCCQTKYLVLSLFRTIAPGFRILGDRLGSIHREGYNIQYPVSKMTTEPYPDEYGA